MEKIGFGGGCHWCTEAVFQSLVGVRHVDQGFIRSLPPWDDYSEAVIVDFDPRAVGLDVLIEVHLLTHASTSKHKMRGKYRSAIYTLSEQQQTDALRHLDTLQNDFSDPLITRVLPFEAFRASDPRLQDYYRQNPSRPFCVSYIEPKLRLLRARFGKGCQGASLGQNAAGA